MATQQDSRTVKTVTTKEENILLGEVVDATEERGASLPATVNMNAVVHEEVGRIRAVKPESMTSEEEMAICARAQEFVKRVLIDPSEHGLADEVLRIGEDAMEENTAHVALLDRKIGAVLKEVVNTDSPVVKTLVQIKAQLDLVNPTVLKSQPIAYRFTIGLLTYLPKNEQILGMIAERRETSASTLTGLREHLWEERDKVMTDAEELKIIADNLQDVQPKLLRGIYYASLIWEGLGKISSSITDPMQAEMVRNLLTDISTQVIDLKTIDNLNLQSRIGAETLIRNSRTLYAIVRRTNNVLQIAVANGLAVRAGAAQQAHLLNFTREIQEAAGKTIADTAVQVRHDTVMAEKMRTEAVIRLDYLEQACTQYEAMFREQDEVRNASLAIAEKTSERISLLSNKLRVRADAMTHGRREQGA